MPHSLTSRQREYLKFIREYIKTNECAPRLEEIAANFSVTKPTANKMLNALQDKGHISFNRDKKSGFYIRLPERYTAKGTQREIMIAGNLDRYGEVLQFPKYHGHLPFMLPDEVGDVLALDVYQHIPSAGILAKDRMIFARGGEAKPGDICIFPFGDRNFLVRIYKLEFTEDTPFSNLSNHWENDFAEGFEGCLLWWPLAITEDNI